MGLCIHKKTDVVAVRYEVNEEASLKTMIHKMIRRRKWHVKFDVWFVVSAIQD